MFFHTSPRNRTIRLLYIDDMIIIEDDIDFLELVKTLLHRQFHMKARGPHCYFLGIEVAYGPVAILSKHKYITNL